MLTGKNAIVTGASRGIGAQIAKTLAKNGAFVIVNYNGSKDKAEEVVAEIKAAGGEAIAIQKNVADFEEAKEFLWKIHKKFRRKKEISAVNLHQIPKNRIF